MQRRLAGWVRHWSLCAAIVMGLSLATAPVLEAVTHGPAGMVAEAEHRAFHAGHGHSHDLPGGHLDWGDHDHVGVAILASSATEFHPPPERTQGADGVVGDGTIRDGPRRPPRLMMA